MNDDLHRYLDGDGSLEDLSAETRDQADAWDRLLSNFRTKLPAAPPPPWLEQSVMAEIEALPEPGLLGRVGRWLFSPRPVRISPAMAGLAAAAVAFLFLLQGPWGQRPGGVAGGSSDGSAAEGGLVPAAAQNLVVYVQFSLEAPNARSVSVAGDFDGWAGSHALEDVDGDGIWTGRIALSPGVHAYMFVIDETDWITDPHAQRYADDGFGNRNAILAVATPSA